MICRIFTTLSCTLGLFNYVALSPSFPPCNLELEHCSIAKCDI